MELQSADSVIDPQGFLLAQKKSPTLVDGLAWTWISCGIAAAPLDLRAQPCASAFAFGNLVLDPVRSQR
jgi:hypothetical protein